ncbi:MULTISPECIES: hypothetical protein [unclassified Pusillimonas]|nr:MULTISPECIES: hypothetical protein [unclassified Pusillimonas]
MLSPIDSRNGVSPPLFAIPDQRNRDIDGYIGAIKHYVDGIR